MRTRTALCCGVRCGAVRCVRYLLRQHLLHLSENVQLVCQSQAGKEGNQRGRVRNTGHESVVVHLRTAQSVAVAPTTRNSPPAVSGTYVSKQPHHDLAVHSIRHSAVARNGFPKVLRKYI